MVQTYMFSDLQDDQDLKQDMGFFSEILVGEKGDKSGRIQCFVVVQ